MNQLRPWARALERLAVGMRVRLTAAGKAAGLQGHARSDRGTVTSIRAGWLAVRRDGLRQSDTYHTSFWRPL